MTAALSFAAEKGTVKYAALWLLIGIAALMSAISVIVCVSDKLRSKKNGALIF